MPACLQGFCGPSACSATAVSTPGCVFTANNVNYANMINKPCRSCTQSTLAMCSSANLASLVVGSVKAAFCTGDYTLLPVPVLHHGCVPRCTICRSPVQISTWSSSAHKRPAGLLALCWTTFPTHQVTAGQMWP